MPQKVLLIEDDAKLAALLRDYLAKHDVLASIAGEGREGLRLARQGGWDALLLDVMLPGMDGFEILRQLRQDSDLPVLMLTARAELSDKVLGLENGADDYLPKPFEPRELLARLKAVLRRHRGQGSKGEKKYGTLKLDLGRMKASLKEKDLGLSPYEFTLLSALAQAQGRVLSRDQLMDRLKGEASDAFDRSIDVAISKLRSKLGDDPRKPRYILTVYGQGYAFGEPAS